jgi:hypothetical protein
MPDMSRVKTRIAWFSPRRVDIGRCLTYNDDPTSTRGVRVPVTARLATPAPGVIAEKRRSTYGRTG